MGANSKIEWTDASWTPIRARGPLDTRAGWHCEHVSPGCVNCYAESINRRLGTGFAFKPGHRSEADVFLDDDLLLAPLRWKKPRTIFVCSMTDLFADFVKDEWIDKVFAAMALCPQHTFQVLTKRAERMRKYMGRVTELCDGEDGLSQTLRSIGEMANVDWRNGSDSWPLPNVWLGASAEDQERADERIPHLLATPAAVRFVSAEPLLGPLDLTNIAPPELPYKGEAAGLDALAHYNRTIRGVLDWVICGGESGPGARPMHPDWARSLRDQCKAAGVPFFFKQWGAHLPVGQHLPGRGKVHGATAVKPGRMKLHCGGTPRQAPKHAFAEHGVAVASDADGRLTFRVGKKAAGRLLDGVEHNEMPLAAEREKRRMVG